MKDRIMIFIIGLLLGAIIATGAIYVYTLGNNNQNGGGGTTQMQMPNGNPPSGENGGPPDMPNGNNMPSNNQASNG